MEFLLNNSEQREGETAETTSELNGSILNDVLLPDEIINLILSYVKVKNILNCRLVCKKWNEILTSNHYWRMRLDRVEKQIKKSIPWYAFYCYCRNNVFDKNLLKNGNGQNQFRNWKITENGGNRWTVEAIPQGADQLPENQPEFNQLTSCFATSYSLCSKKQTIDLKNNKLVRRILDELQPKIYVSEWYAGRHDCGCKYRLGVKLYDHNGQILYEKSNEKRVAQWEGSAWSKVEIVCENYGKGVTAIEFLHEGSDTQYWAGHYGSKMAGALVQISFDSILFEN